MSEEQLLENKNKPKVIYFYKELFRYITYEKTFALFRK
jgi:hypothetical protein